MSTADPISRPNSAPQMALHALAENRRGRQLGLTSVCSAHPHVIAAALRGAARHGQVALIEATCNQVNQEGGYTGMTPADFARLVRDIAAGLGLSREALLLGGDHLGPQPWRRLGAAEAMARAEVMVADYVRAGFQKIHLDCSMSCADDPEPLDEAVIAGRAARLARAAEAAAGETPPFYVIGTEVPPPGGMGEGHEIVPTLPASVQHTVEAHRAAFAAAGLGAAFARVAAVVVQPGLDFGNETVADFDVAAAAPLSRAIGALDGLVFEAHSTDYQFDKAYRDLVAGHFAILKVGPAATFALREALYALELLERELVAPDRRSGLRDALETAMLDHPEHWNGHYLGDPARQAWLRHFSLSDRLRYYWTVPGVDAALKRLEANIDGDDIPYPLAHQYLPHLAGALRGGAVAPTLKDIARASVEMALEPYFLASEPHRDKEDF
ncbi:class II D-tagatose-bisphosphate aldolase non-catalytic subunit [Oceaniglobus trochenteri]|uniref:class II D-tagatose-bisphosphate aldolase non-catalytic subunit n=1 Tax=Oceaniglobus trochenteri TaxID=2763260 RepID=UPI001CFF6377|nr:class II D-tagatose-bisphosphate aldolase, non-catalytic subunit [Oceaniglobus trochenteri]